MAAIDWDSLASPDDWEGALVTLQQEAPAAKAGTRADRQALENELANFWLIPCPFAKKIERARTTYNELVLIDLGQLIDATAVAPPPPAPPAPRTLAPHEQQLAQTMLQTLTALHEQHRQLLATHLAMAQQIKELHQSVQQLLPAPTPRPKRRAPRQPPPGK